MYLFGKDLVSLGIVCAITHSTSYLAQGWINMVPDDVIFMIASTFVIIGTFLFVALLWCVLFLSSSTIPFQSREAHRPAFQNPAIPTLLLNPRLPHPGNRFLIMPQSVLEVEIVKQAGMKSYKRTFELPVGKAYKMYDSIMRAICETDQ